MTEVLHFKVSCLVLLFEKKALTYEAFISKIDSILLKDDTSNLAHISLSKSENELIKTTYQFLDYKLHPKSYLFIIAEILKASNKKNHLQRIDFILYYFQNPINLEHKPIDYLSEDKLLNKLYNYLYLSWNHLHLSSIGLGYNMKE